MKTKVCTKCKIEKKTTEFYMKNNKKGWLRPECKKCSVKLTRERKEKQKNGWKVYILPKEKYAGITNHVPSRKSYHRSTGKNLEGFKVVASYDKVELAIIHEARLHLRGYRGCHLKKNKEEMICGNLITENEIYEQLYERTDTIRNEKQDRDFGSDSSKTDDGNGSHQNFIFWN